MRIRTRAMIIPVAFLAVTGASFAQEPAANALPPPAAQPGPEAASAGETPPAAPALTKGIALVRIGEVDEALLDRLRRFVQKQTAIPVHVHEARAPAATTLFDECTALKGNWEENDICLVGLAWPAEPIPDHAVYLYDEGIGVVNVRALKPDADDAELHGRRIEKLTMRSIGLLLNVAPVPNPQSALYPYKDLQELDTIGRDFDPPTLIRVQKAAREKGVTEFVKDSPYFHFLGK